MLALYTVSFILVISVIVFIHELGHYLVAKSVGVKVTDFAIGFGPKIFSWKDKSGTEWKFCWIPLGGYVKFSGDENPTSLSSKHQQVLSEQEKAHSFESKGLLAKSAIAVAGPVANFLLAIVILAGFFYIYGKVVVSNEITVVEEGSRADHAGLQSGDKIIAIDGNSIEEFADVELYVATHPNIALNFTIKRQDKTFARVITPTAIEKIDDLGNKNTIGKLGVASSKFEYKKYGLISSVNLAINSTFKICSLTLKAIGQMLTGVRGAKDVGGIIKISKYTAQSVKQGLAPTLYLVAMLSINLGLINLLPIPPLDGGHLFLYSLESVFGRKKIYTYVKEYAIKIGFALLIALMAFAIINDIINF